MNYLDGTTLLPWIVILATGVVMVSLVSVLVILATPKPTFKDRFDGSKWDVWEALQESFGVCNIDGVWSPGQSGQKIYESWFMMPGVTKAQSRWICEFVETLKQVTDDTLEERMKAYPIGIGIEWDSEGNYKLIQENKDGEADEADPQH